MTTHRPCSCSQDQHGQFAEDVAAASLRLQPLQQAEEQARQQVAGNRTALKVVRGDWS